MVSFEFRSYTGENLCIISCLSEYLIRRDKHVVLNSDQLIITLKKPFKGALKGFFMLIRFDLNINLILAELVHALNYILVILKRNFNIVRQAMHNLLND